MRPTQRKPDIRALLETLAQLREQAASARTPSRHALETLAARLASVDLAGLPSSARIQFDGASAMLAQAMAATGGSQNAWTRVRLHLEMAQIDLQRLAKDDSD